MSPSTCCLPCAAILGAKAPSKPERGPVVKGGPGSLHEAVRSGRIDLINKCLDDEDVDVDAKDESGLAPLHHAAITGEAATGSLLCEVNACVDVTDHKGNTPLMYTAMYDNRLVTSMLLWGGADRCLQNDLGNTAIHEAAVRGSKDVAWLIIENGGERTKDYKNKAGKLPIDLARDHGHSALVEMLASKENEYGDGCTKYS